jgi:thioredoxin-related protein
LVVARRAALRGVLRLACATLLIAAGAAPAQQASPYAIDIPKWFEETFLVLPEDARDAARAGKRLMVYFGQDGCPYCRQLMQENFTQRAIVDKTRKHFVAIAINVWGDRDVVWTDGRSRPEKDFAAHLKVQFTPTVLFLDEKGGVVARLNGYYPPHRFEAAIDYVAQRMERKQDFASYMKAATKDPASAKLHDQPFFMKPPYDLRRRPGGKPLAVMFETPYCSGCDELHRDGLQRPELRELLGKFDVARFALTERVPVVAPDGKKTTADEWVRTLQVAYTPTILFFDVGGKEAFRIESYLRPFHLASSFDYVASGAWRSQPSFQRFVQLRAEKLRAKGERVDLWQ